MKRIITAAVYKNYNANSSGRNTTDCVNRAISLAFKKSYNEVHKELLSELHSQRRYSSYKMYPIYEKLILGWGGQEEKELPINQTVSEFCDDMGSEGTYILETHEKPQFHHRGNHLTCVIDGVLYDSWDSSNCYVCGYYTVKEGKTDREFTDIQSHFDEYREKIPDMIMDEVDRITKKEFHGCDRTVGVRAYDEDGVAKYGLVKGYTIKFPCEYEIQKFGKNHQYVFNISYVFTPETTEEEAEKIIKDTTKVRVYDRIYEIKKDLKKKEEEYEVQQQLGVEYTTTEHLFLDGREERFYNSLPGWCKPLITYLNVDRPGQYSNSYRLNINPLPGDPNREMIKLESYQGSEIREMLDMYKKDFSRPFDDYDPYEIF